jgi:LysM repeat protein
MNTPSPLVPQGTQPQRGKSSLYFKIMMILTVHVVVIGGMLLQGCKDTAKTENKESTTTQTAQNDTTSPSASSTVPPASDASIPPAVTSTAAISNQAVSTMPPVQTASAPAVSAPPIASMPATQPASGISGDGREYVIAAGDTLAAIAKKNSVSLKALVEANPGVSPKKLQIGHKLQIPAGGMAVASASPASASSMSAPASTETSSERSSATYTVKSGDTLGKIARAHGTSFKKIMAINDLKTTAIRVGQKLKMPAPKPAGADAAPASASISSTASASPGPVSSVSAPVSASPSGVAN